MQPVFVLVAIVIIVAVVAVVRQVRKDRSNQSPTRGLHEAPPKTTLPASSQPSATATTQNSQTPATKPSKSASSSTSLRQYLEGVTLGVERKDRGGRRYLIGRDGDDFIIIVIGRSAKRPWRYVCTGGKVPVLWGAPRPFEECALPDNSSTADLDPLEGSSVELLLELLGGSSPARA